MPEPKLTLAQEYLLIKLRNYLFIAKADEVQTTLLSRSLTVFRNLASRGYIKLEKRVRNRSARQKVYYASLTDAGKRYLDGL